MMKFFAKSAMTSASIIAMLATISSASETANAFSEADFNVGTFVLLGLTVVLGILILLSVITAVIGKIFINIEKQKVAKKESSAPTSAPVAVAVAEEEDSELVAVLAAAAMEALEAEVRIVSYKPSFSLWSREGRAQQAALVNK